MGKPLAIYNPGPSYRSKDVETGAGWWKILKLQQDALEELGYEVWVPDVPEALIERRGTVSTITSYDLVAASQLRAFMETRGVPTLFLGVPGYSVAQLMVLPPRTKRITYYWNSADWWRDQQLAEEYKKFPGFREYDLSPSWRWLNAEACRLSDYGMACSPFVKNTWAKVTPELPADKIHLAFWGVDSEMFKPAAQEPPGFRVLFSGGDVIRKGLPYLYQALDGMQGVELWLVGTPDLRVNIPGVKTRILGAVPHAAMPSVMRQCHVIAIPTLEDGIAMAIQEGMASGLVPIATPDAAEVFEDGVSGYKVGFRDVAGLREKLVFLRDRPDLRRRTAMYSRALAQQQTWARFREDFKQVIQRSVRGESVFESELPWLNR